MEVGFTREARASYMKIEATDFTDGNQMKMASGNTLTGFLPIVKRSINNREQYLYDISSLIPVTEAFDKREMRAVDVTGLIKAIKTAVDVMEQYLLEQEGLILQPDKIFYDTNTKEYRFCYFSGCGGKLEEDLKELFEYVIRNVCHSDNEAVTLAYGVYKSICSGNINLNGLPEIERSEKTEQYQIIEEQTAVKDIIPEIIQEQHEEPDKMKLYTAYAVAGGLVLVFILGLVGIFVPKLRIGNFSTYFYVGICTIIGVLLYGGYKWFEKNKDSFIRVVTTKTQVPYEKTDVRILMPKDNKEPEEKLTVVLNSESDKIKHESYIKWEGHGDSCKYRLETDVCVIGSAYDKADCVIDMPGISRIHARISKEGDTYYIKDLNSTNGTFVNGKQLACFEMCEIRHNDSIIFGNVECVFI